jgi:hypothetical protein
MDINLAYKIGSVRPDWAKFAIWVLLTWAFSIFNLIKQFQSMVCDTLFNIQKRFDATIILSFDYLAAVWATFPKIGQFFFQISGHSGLGLIMLSVIKLSVVWLSVVIRNIVMPNVVIECRYAKCHCADRHNAQCCYSVILLSVFG